MSDKPAGQAAIPSRIPLELIDGDALRVLARLHRSGFAAYLVGGCVRDLLLGKRPKDFDIGTSAHPQEVRATFRNCRLIGRRFRLAQVYFKGNKIIEVSTFRANPMDAVEDMPEGDRLIRQDNVFGTAEEDARRRDFTVNGLFYDVQDEKVIDYVGGLPDLATRLIRTIGDPMLRLAEDPVRILRAVRFAAKLSLGIDADTHAAMRRFAVEIPRCAPPRVLEELLKLLRSGASHRAFELLHEVQGLDVLLPALAEHLDRVGPEGLARMWEMLAGLDARVAEGPVPDDSVLLSTLLWDLPRGGDGAAGFTIDEVLQDMTRNSRLPRRVADRARLIMGAIPVMTGEAKRRRRWSAASFVRTHYFGDSLELFSIVVRGSGKGGDSLERWRARARGEEVPEEPTPPEGFAEEPPAAGKKRRRRRRRGGRKNRGQGAPAGGSPAA